MDWPEPLFLFNVFKSFCAVASQREQPFHLLHRHVSNSMKNDSYTGCEVAPASSVPYIFYDVPPQPAGLYFVSDVFPHSP